MSTNELIYLENLINEMQEKQDEVKALNDEIEATKFLIRETLETQGLDRLSTATHSIVYSECERTTIDKKILQKDFPDIFGKVAKISRYKALRVN